MPHTILKVEQFDFSHFSRECGNFIFDATSISCNVNKVRVVLNLFCYRAKPNCKVRVCNCNSKLVQLEKWVAPFKKLRPESVSKRIPRMRANARECTRMARECPWMASKCIKKYPDVSRSFQKCLNASESQWFRLQIGPKLAGRYEVPLFSKLFAFRPLKPIKSMSWYEIKQILLFMTFMFPNKTKTRRIEPVI